VPAAGLEGWRDELGERLRQHYGRNVNGVPELWRGISARL
jgi:hypothetical protein